jgi:hypothetical protein
MIRNRRTIDAESVFGLFELDSSDILEVARFAGVDPSYELSRAKLGHVDFSRKILDGFDFSAADLTGASLADASVFLTDFSYAEVDIAALKGALNADCAIWPDSVVVNSEDPTIQRALRRAKAVHDSFNGPNKFVDRDIEILGKTEQDPIFNVAMILDTIGAKLAPVLYRYFDYLLMKPFHYKLGSKDDFIERQQKVTSTSIPMIDDGMLWVVTHHVNEAVLYCREPVDQAFENLSSFFWREKLYYRERLIAEHINRRAFDAARRSIQLSRDDMFGRHVPWRESVLLMHEAIIAAASDQENKFVPLDAVRTITHGLNAEERDEAIRFFIWEIYTASVHLESVPLKEATAALLTTFADLFFEKDTEVSDQPKRLLGELPGFWEMVRRDPGAAAKRRRDRGKPRQVKA